MSYTSSVFNPTRRQTISVPVGNRVIGGDAPILIQSMTTTNTKDIDATVMQTLELAHAGCELVRITVPTVKDGHCLGEIVKKVRAAGCDVPISADIHFQPKARRANETQFHFVQVVYLMHLFRCQRKHREQLHL